MVGLSARVTGALLLAGLLSGCGSVSSNYTGDITQVPSSRIFICSGHDCYHKTPVPVTRADASRLASIMAKGRGSAQAERAAVSQAVQYFEERTAKALGRRDSPMSQFGHAAVLGEMDCVDEGTNTQSLLRYLAGRGLLRHHTVQGNVSRGFVLDGQFPHVTAVLREKGGADWAVDSWVGATGEPPTVMPLKKWLVDGNLGREIGAAF